MGNRYLEILRFLEISSIFLKFLDFRIFGNSSIFRLFSGFPKFISLSIFSRCFSNFGLSDSRKKNDFHNLFDMVISRVSVSFSPFFSSNFFFFVSIGIDFVPKVDF